MYIYAYAFSRKGQKTMSEYFIYYTEASLVCVVIFGIMLARDLFSVDRQEKQIKYDSVLIAFMLYFISDALWAAVIADMLPRNKFTVLSTNFANCVIMSAITYTWLRYVMAVEQVPDREKRACKLITLLPFLLSTLALVGTYLIAPGVLLSADLRLQSPYYVFQILVPCIYIAAVLGYTLKRAWTEESPIERKRHLFVGFFPLMVIMGGLVQVLLLPETPIFCFSCAILMLLFYINAMDTQISTDPLTSLNNRGQLLHYTSQKSNLRREGRQTHVVMFDINDFKAINDTYGHAEGDRALVLVAESLKRVTHNHNTPMFLARYGGDEFILIVHPVSEGEIDPLIDEIRAQIVERCEKEDAPYRLSIGAGHAALSGPDDTFQHCMQRADEKLYADKAHQKQRGGTVLLR